MMSTFPGIREQSQLINEITNEDVVNEGVYSYVYSGFEYDWSH